MVRLGTYAAASVVATMGVIYHAFASREQFYPAMVYLSTSKINLVLLLNMAFVILYSLWQLVKVVFLGQLREAEVERLNEQLWRELMEVLFAMTIFREEFNVSFVAMVTVLLFVKAFHWLAQKRVEYIEITPSVSRLSHFRISGFMFFLLFLDAIFVRSSVGHLLKTRKPSVSLFFAFEYIILATSVVSMLLKYTLYMGDMWMEGQWDNKAVYIFYLELIRDLLHLSLYLFFFLVIFLHYGLPLHLVRELYEIIRNFKARVTDFIRYRKVTSNMNERFPDATPEELGRSDATCIICREEMTVAKKLPCGHLFHVHCLRSWLERQQTCPTCRAPVIPPETTSSESVAQREQQQSQPAIEGQANSNTTEGSAPAQAPIDAAQARLQAAAAAAVRYSSSFVYPSVHSGTMNWYPMYVPAVPQQTVQSSGVSTTTEADSPLEYSANISTQEKAGQVYFMPVIAAGGARFPTHLKADEKSKYLESTIQLLRQQLDAAVELQRSCEQESKSIEEQQSNVSSEEETSHDRKGKAPVKSDVEGEQEASSSSL